MCAGGAQQEVAAAAGGARASKGGGTAARERGVLAGVVTRVREVGSGCEGGAARYRSDAGT